MLAPVVLNIISIQVAARVNNLAMFTEIIGTVVFGVLLFVLWGVKSRPSPYGFGILTNTTSVSHNPTIYAFALAGLLGAFTLVGFELAADMSEDAVNPRRSVPRGVIWAVAGSAFLGMIALIGFTVAIPSLKAVEAPRVRHAGRRDRDHPVHHLLPHHPRLRLQAEDAGQHAGRLLARPVG
jgi:amino acid transporter